MTQPLRVGLVGAGAIAQSYAQVLRSSEHMQAVGVADPRLEAAQALAEDLGCPSFESHEKLADDGRCEAMVVCTPPASHAPICLDLLGRSLPVLCEKPLALDSTSARAMLNAADDAGVVFTMASKFRYVEDVMRAKEIVTSGGLGDVVLFENAFTSRVDMSQRWNSDPAVAGGGVLIDNGTHSVDLVRYFLGPIEAVSCVEGKRIQGLPVEDTVRVFLRTREGVLANVDLSWSVNKELPTFLDIYGSEGTLRVGWSESKHRPVSSPEWIPFGKGYDKLEAFANQLENFSLAIRGEEPLLLGAEEALASVEVIEAAYESLRKDDWVAVKTAS
jgi:predicted dehydrogenase